MASTKTLWPKLVVGHTYRYEFRTPDQPDSAQPYHAGTWTVEAPAAYAPNSAGAFRAYVMRWTKRGDARAIITEQEA